MGRKPSGAIRQGVVAGYASQLGRMMCIIRHSLPKVD
jgi:hypothetical protein